jgi:hypothetical protein
MKLCLAALFLSLALSACGGGGGSGGGPSGPTEPPAPKNLLIVDVVLVPQSNGGLEEASLTLDGREIFHLNTGGGSCQSDCHLPATVADVAAGEHTIEARVIRQSRSRISYITVGSVTYGTSAGTGQQITLPSKIITLQAGDKLTYPITL